MRRIIGLLSILLVLPAILHAQVCGNVDGIGGVNVNDGIRLYNQLVIPAGPPLIGNGDVDGYSGITIADVISLFDRVYHDTPIDCSGALSYSFAASSQDTIFVPYMSQIPDDMESVVVYIGYSLADSSRGLYLPFLTRSVLATTNFRLSHVSDIGLDALMSCDRSFWDVQDTVIATYCGFPIGGRRFPIKLTYIRTGSGPGEVRPMLVDRDTLWRVAVERGSDLVVPTVVTYEVPVPPDSLMASGALQFTEIEGESFHWCDVDFKTNSQSTTFRLRASDWWISVPFDGLAITPLRARFRVNTTGMDAGVHNGYVFVEAEDPNMVVACDTIPVYLYVQPRREFLNGDLDCNKLIDLSDLSRMIAYLAAYAPLPPLCF